MKLVIFPAVEKARLLKIVEAAGSMTVVNAADEATARREIADAEAFFGKITPELLKATTQLQWVQSPTASLEHYLFPELIAHPCRLSNMRGIFNDVIADHVLAYVTCIARNLHLYLRQQWRKEWAPVGGEAARTTFAAGPSTISEMDRRHLHLADCTLGVFGVGGIGGEVCRRAKAFGMTILGVDPMVRALPGVVDDIWPTDRLPDLLRQSDFVVIAAPHTPETEKLFRRSLLQRMKPSAWLINIGRGAIVDLADLTAALRANEIAGAALDVFETEPLPADHPLWEMTNVILTPHVAACSPRIAERHTATLLENIRRFATGEPLATQVDKTKWF